MDMMMEKPTVLTLMGGKVTNNYMKMTNDNKLKIVTLSHNIKALCYILDKKTFSEHCVASGTFTEIESLFELAKELKEMNKEE